MVFRRLLEQNRSIIAVDMSNVGRYWRIMYYVREDMTSIRESGLDVVKNLNICGSFVKYLLTVF